MNPPFKIQENVPLAPFTTLKVGGSARFFVRAETERQVAQTVKFAGDNSLSLFVLGGGSNILVADDGFEGVVLLIAIAGINHLKSNVAASELVKVGAGEDWDTFVEYCVNRGLAGVECLSGIPGRVGGTPVQNVGAYGQEVAETIAEVTCFDRKTREIISLSKAKCEFSYRTSIFNSHHRERFIVLSVTFELGPNRQPKLVYKDLIEHFANEKPSIADVREGVLKIRRAKSMVIDETDPNSRSAGSFFKNPIVSYAKLEEVKTSFVRAPSFEYGNMFKIPAAWLIENAGFAKGFESGQVGLSSKHTLAIINRGNATAAEIIVLKDRIQRAVAEKFGIDLIPEPVFVGFPS